jgi:hypothetical protein
MKVPRAKSWLKLVAVYWLLMALIFFLEFKYMDSDWAGLPGFLLTLPLSALVVGVGLAAGFAERYSSLGINVTSYHFEYGFVVCAFLNAFILYPFYIFWMRRKEKKTCDPPPPPNIGMQRTRK